MLGMLTPRFANKGELRLTVVMAMIPNGNPFLGQTCYNVIFLFFREGNVHGGMGYFER
jgi:hypothetical protein